MPSPFPGMDPYLEDPARWPNVHHGLISEIQALLTSQLRPKYYVRVEERVYVSDEDDPGREVLIPDVRIARGARHKARGSGRKKSPALQVAEPIVRTTLLDDEIHEAGLRVVDGAGKKVVTFIEVLSPTNKIASSRGRASYEEKRREVMSSPSHFVEIDLLRAGVPIPTKEERPAGDYFVHVSRAAQRPDGEIWPISIRQKLPVIPIPLNAEDPDALLDLQAVLDNAYDRGGYDLDTDFRKSPVPPLRDEDAEWGRKVLKKKGLR